MGLLTFKKGVHPRDQKHFTSAKKIEELPLPKEVFIPLSQHIGKPASCLVKKKEFVKTGQVIGKTDGAFSTNIHSTVTGTVKAVANFLHPNGSRVPMVHIERAEEEEWELMTKPEDWKTASVDELRQLVHDAGIVGLGGAAFPTHIKLNPPPKVELDSFLLNGCECEPYLTCDHRMMVEWADKILLGIAITIKILGIKNVYIGIEHNKQEAIDAMKERVAANGYDFNVCPLETKYPQGAEKMLISAILNREVPAGGLPSDVGCVVNNVGTAYAIAEAVVEGKPLVDRVVTVTGDSINEPKNILTRMGVTFQEMVDYCGGVKPNIAQIFAGGPMMGISQFDLSVPVIKGTSGIVCTSEANERKHETHPCIRCNSCVSVCPVFLLPNRLFRFNEKDKTEEALKLGLMNCIECGSCVFTCPSHIPILQWIRIGKHRVRVNSQKVAGK